jgi:hypothetical protein
VAGFFVLPPHRMISRILTAHEPPRIMGRLFYLRRFAGCPAESRTGAHAPTQTAIARHATHPRRLKGWDMYHHASHVSIYRTGADRPQRSLFSIAPRLYDLYRLQGRRDGGRKSGDVG